MAKLPLLSMLIWTPIFGGLAMLLIDNIKRLKYLSLFIAGLTFILSIMLYGAFDLSQSGMQFTEQINWIDTFNISYHIGVDGIALPLILLTTFTTVLIILATWRITDRIAYYIAAFLILEGLMNGVFLAMDAILFYIFWEAMLIPMFIIIGIWGGANRVYANIKFFLYTFFGSVLMLVALLYLYKISGSFNIQGMYQTDLGLTAQKWLFIAFLLAFAVKIPMWPVHTWLPDAHVEAPTEGSMILAAVMLKMGGYGLLRFSLPITPEASSFFAEFMIILSLIAIVYIGLIALVQADMKKLIAYSSVSHMGFVTLGLFVPLAILNKGMDTEISTMGMTGAMIQMLSHGLISAAMFFSVGILYQRTHSRLIQDYGGVVNSMPHFAAFMMLFAMANAGLPGTSGFVGEFLVILASFKLSVWIAFIAGLTLILGAAYTLWMYKRVIFGAVANEKIGALKPMDMTEWSILCILALSIIFLGVWPSPIEEIMYLELHQLLQHIISNHT